MRGGVGGQPRRCTRRRMGRDFCEHGHVDGRPAVVPLQAREGEDGIGDGRGCRGASLAHMSARPFEGGRKCMTYQRTNSHLIVKMMNGMLEQFSTKHYHLQYVFGQQ